MTALTDQPALLERIAQGDQECMRRLIDQYTGLVWSLVRRKVSNKADAEDLVQDIFAEIWKSAKRYKPEMGSEATFVSVITRRRVIDYIRKVTRRDPEVQFDGAVEYSAADTPQSNETSSEEIASAMDIMRSMSPQRRQVLELSVIHGLSHSQIVESTSMPLGTVKAHIRRGLEEVRSMGGVTMTDAHNPQFDDRAMDLILDRVLGETENYSDDSIDAQLYQEMELAAAVLDQAAAESAPLDMPESLADRIKSEVDQYPAQQVYQSESPYRIDQHTPQSTPQRVQWVPWMVAAASLLIASAAILLPRSAPVIQPQPVDLVADRLALIDQTPVDELTQWDWISTDDQAVVGEVIGDVVWSDTLNKGYMRISGLAVNDPSLEQYQLWIFDATRPTGDLPQFGEGLLTQRPIDGGVFDINSAGEVIIEIDSKLAVKQAAAFAITVEPPGGVVVSDRTRVPLLALAP
ncbi:sigK [Symbiodinium sp. CCMP2592]|nr:sigK [Symbiodinium sp. CCMP2592]